MKSAPSVDVPEQAVVKDPLIVQNGTVAGRTWRYAVMSDAQFVGRDLDSEPLRCSRRSARCRSRTPINSQWYGDGVTIGGHGGIASFDSGSGTLTAHRPGTFTLTLVVNGTSETVGVRVQR